MSSLEKIQRSLKIYGLDRFGTKHEEIASGFYASVLQHEIDHLNGILFVDRVKFDETPFVDVGHLLLT